MARDRLPNAVRIWVTAVVAGVGLAGPLCGCAVSFPVPGFVDTASTGSIKGRAADFSSDLDKEDWRRADAALAVALDPQGNGEEATWHNPISGARGSFAAAAPPFLDHDRVCRAFKASVAAAKAADRRIDGSACRTSDGNWVLAEVKNEAGPGKAHLRAEKPAN